MAPLEAPLHATFVTTVVPLTALAGCVTVALTVAVHPLASVMVTVYVPADKPVLSSVVIPPPQLNV